MIGFMIEYKINRIKRSRMVICVTDQPTTGSLDRRLANLWRAIDRPMKLPGKPILDHGSG
jgi:hypothetical protein